MPRAKDRTMKIQTRILSSLCGALVLSAAYLGNATSAQACDCMEQDFTQHYSQSDAVFRGTTLFSFEFGSKRLVLAYVLQNYKGCMPGGRVMWLETERSSAACGTSFSYGRDYLIFGSEQSALFPGTVSTNDCSGNRLFNGLSQKELEFLNGRDVCCGDSCECAGGQERVNCIADPCEVSQPCEGQGAVTCESNYCGGCHAEFFNSEGKMVCTGDDEPTQCTSDAGCPDTHYCNFEGICAQDTTCTYNGECDLPGNEFEVSIDCEGYGSCTNGACGITCGDPRCVDHKGYDFGECEMVVGWLVQDGKCVNISSGCGSLSPNNLPRFTSKTECESSCEFEPTTFACGDKLRCDRETSYCENSVPGVMPQPGEPTEYFECRPLPEQCKADPNCDACFAGNPEYDAIGAAWNCVDLGQGELFLDVAYP